MSHILMPLPTKIAWTMEELLQPYVPLFPNWTNVEEQIDPNCWRTL